MTTGERHLSTNGSQRCFVQRDFSHGMSVRFQSNQMPSRLVGKITPSDFASAIEELNKLFDEAEAISCDVVCENIVGCLFAYLLFLCMPTHYERKLEKIAYKVVKLNDQVFMPRGLLMIDPAERGLRVIEIVLIGGNVSSTR